MNEPYFYLMGLTLADLEDLVADIKVIFIIYNVNITNLTEFLNIRFTWS